MFPYVEACCPAEYGRDDPDEKLLYLVSREFVCDAEGGDANQEHDGYNVDPLCRLHPCFPLPTLSISKGYMICVEENKKELGFRR